MTDLIEKIISIQCAYAELLEDVRIILGNDTDIPPAAAITALCIGDKSMTPTEIGRLGYYAGTNFSYNSQRLVKAGIIVAKQGGDRRKVLLHLTAKGLELAEKLRRGLGQKYCRLAELEKAA